MYLEKLETGIYPIQIGGSQRQLLINSYTPPKILKQLSDDSNKIILSRNRIHIIAIRTQVVKNLS